MTTNIASNSIQFLIVTPTFQRPGLLRRAIQSVQKQSYQNWHMYICDDNSGDATQDVVADCTAWHGRDKFTCLTHADNQGANKARNSILNRIAADQKTGFLVLLDDDDYLTERSLLMALETLQEHSTEQWLVSNCATPKGRCISQIHRYGHLSYLEDYMFGKVLRGDLCHMIHTDIGLKFRFTEAIKNGEEWYYFCQLATSANIYAYDFVGMVRDYQPGGLSDTGINRDRKLEVNYLKVELLSRLCPHNTCMEQRLSLVRSLLEHHKLEEASAELARLATTGRFRMRYWRYKAKLLRTRLQAG